MTKQIHVQVPATSANIGSGFDAVGIAQQQLKIRVLFLRVVR